jgi:RNA polymerase sigma-70 factor (ECF subfamily)
VAGDPAALEKLLLINFPALERHLAPRIPSDARRHFGLEDIMQEVLSQAFRDIKQFQYREHASFLAWLRKIADHRLSDALKRIGRKKRGGDLHQLSSLDFAKNSTIATFFDIVGHDSHVPQDSVMRREAKSMIHVALASLPENQQEVLRAKYIEGLEVKDIAQQRGQTPAAVRGLLKRGEDNLAEAMGRSSQWLSSR